MKQLSKILLRAVILMVMLVLAISVTNAQDEAAVRFVHVIPDAVPVDVYVNGTLAVKGLEYGETSTYINVPSGDHTVTATPAGIATALWEQSISLASGDAATFIASNGAAPLEATKVAVSPEAIEIPCSQSAVVSPAAVVVTVWSPAGTLI
jgi:hypothetical protein